MSIFQKNKLTHIEYETKTVLKMIDIYCQKNHGKTKLCESCSDLKTYAAKRLKYCRYGEEKPFCNACTTHCYGPKQQEEIRAVMRFSGPRMLFVDPVMAIKHLFQTIRMKQKGKLETN